MRESDGHKPGARDPADIDLYCLTCGYNLRGLSGDPRRCPECGHLNPLGEVEIPAALISARLHKMETAPALCVGAVAMTFLVGALLMLFIIDTPPGPPEMGFCCVWLLFLCGPIIWALQVAVFRSHCLGKPGWARTLWLYHLYGLSLIGVIAGLTAVQIWLCGDVLRRYGWRDAEGTVILLCFGCILAAVGFGGRWAHARLRALLDPLQREVAVTLAREELRRKLQRPH
ncbi:MAG: hypothetical protein AMXMBFR83_16600 [Phycisphaerae bacterium]